MAEPWSTDWSVLTRRTNDPKLAWLKAAFDVAGIPWRQVRESFHAPILEVATTDLERAERILEPVDDIPDDDPRFVQVDDEPWPDGTSHRDYVAERWSVGYD